MSNIFNSHLRQILLLALIIMMAILLISTLYVFLPGLLGSITLYIITRKFYFKLTKQKKWNTWLTALLFIILCIIIIAIPVSFSIHLISPKINLLINNNGEILKALDIFLTKAESFIGQPLMTAANAQSVAQKISSFLPSLLVSSTNMISNFGMMFFFFYYLLYSGTTIEKYLLESLPLCREDIAQLSIETKTMVSATAIGIPIVSIIHGIVATIGYFLLGIDDWVLWGFLTGVFAFFPLVGIMVIWVPLTIYLYSIHQNFSATGLIIYSIAVTGNVDLVTRFGILRKLGNIHPMITVLGVIVGLKLFGFMGLIFGPLLISYFIILIKFYTKEFVLPIHKK